MQEQTPFYQSSVHSLHQICEPFWQGLLNLTPPIADPWLEISSSRRLHQPLAMATPVSHRGRSIISVADDEPTHPISATHFGTMHGRSLQSAFDRAGTPVAAMEAAAAAVAVPSPNQAQASAEDLTDAQIAMQTEVLISAARSANAPAGGVDLPPPPSAVPAHSSQPAAAPADPTAVAPGSLVPSLVRVSQRATHFVASALAQAASLPTGNQHIPTHQIQAAGPLCTGLPKPGNWRFAK